MRYARILRSAGAPVDRLLAGAGIPPPLLEHPFAAVPLRTAFRFAELACRALGTEHLGLGVGLATSLDELGPYGQALQSALTFHDYLRKGIALYGMLTTGQRLWVSEHGDRLRFNFTTAEAPGIASYQSECEVLAVTIAQCREAAGPDWSPEEISLAYRSREDLPDVDLFAGSRILRGSGETYFTFPRAAMGLPFRRGARRPPAAPPAASSAVRLPESLGGLVQLQIESLLPDGRMQIGTVAESLGMSVRTLQRVLAGEGLTFSDVLAQTRMRCAAVWLNDGDRRIVDIAIELGYADPANFTRAFRRQTGVPPEAFRDAVRAA